MSPLLPYLAKLEEKSIKGYKCFKKKTVAEKFGSKNYC